MTTTPNGSGGISSLSLSNIIIPTKISSQSLIKKIYRLFKKKYSKLPLSYNTNIIDNIIYNEKSHIVASFKDRLITDDTGEFLKRYYRKNESDVRLPKFYEYYDLYSKIFPNYTVFNEGKYLYQNIQKKQRMIDLQEKMELEEKKNQEKKDTSSLYSESKENVFNTEAIDSILNRTHNEEIQLLFEININNLKQEEELFSRDINNLIREIDNYESKKKKLESSHKIIKNKIMKNNNFNHNFSNNIINSNKNENKKDTIWNKETSAPINLNYSKKKRITNSNSSSTINNTNITNITYYSNIQSIISKFFNIPSYQKNNILNLNNNMNKKGNINSKSKNINKKDKSLMAKLEQNLFKMRQKSLFFQKNLSQNISTTNQTQKDISISKKNSSIYTKKQSTSTSTKHNPIKKQKNVNNSIYKIQNNNIYQNLDLGNKATSPLTTRNPKMNKLGINPGKSTNIKKTKDNTYFFADVISRNKYINNLNFHNKSKSTIRGSLYNESINKMGEGLNIKTNNKNVINNTKINYNKKVKTRKEIGYKEISYIKNKNSRNRNEIKHKILNSGFNNNNSSRNNNNLSKKKNMAQTKTYINKKKNNSNVSTFQLGILDIMNVKKNFVKGFNINNFSKALNGTNINSKNAFSKTHRSNYSIINK